MSPQRIASGILLAYRLLAAALLASPARNLGFRGLGFRVYRGLGFRVYWGFRFEDSLIPEGIMFMIRSKYDLKAVLTNAGHYGSKGVSHKATSGG